MQWLGWVFQCDHNGCDNTMSTFTDAPVGALIEAVRAGWMPGPHRAGSRERVYCPTHAADAKAKA